LNGSRRRRIAQGSGTTVTDINRLMKQFLEMKKMMQRVNKLGMRSLLSRMPNPFQ
jgi:signal recognition particle subunit SRP54